MLSELWIQFLPLFKTIIIPALTPIIIGSVKTLLPKLTDYIPGWLMPVAAGTVGVIAGTLTGLAPDLAVGAMMGLAGTGIHQIKKQFMA